MSKINRNKFLKVGALSLLAPFADSLFLQALPVMDSHTNGVDDALLKKLLTANDAQVEQVLKIPIANQVFSRKTGSDIAVLAASYCSPGSGFYHAAAIEQKFTELISLLVKAQAEDGTVDIGNLESPPDTAFLLELLCEAAFLLKKDASPAIRDTNTTLEKFIVKSGNALVMGGVHTPNHRWVVCAALAHIDALYPNKAYLSRIEEWLGEGIFIDSDGHYPERSRTYDYVENNSLIAMSRLLNKPDLLKAVRKNLSMCWYYIEPNGDMVTTDSRRQDQWIGRDKLGYYLHYRYMAIRDKDAAFAGIATTLENLPGFAEEVLSRSLFRCLENPALLQNLPTATMPPTSYEKLFATSSLLRIRRQDVSTTLFGGADWPIIIASGRSNNPNFYAYRKGQAILKYMRLSTNFFSMGYFYSEGIRKAGNHYILHKTLEIPYYQPLPKNLRNNTGDYKLSPSIDGRFWNKMDFSHRPTSNIKKLDTTISFRETAAGNELSFDIKGQAGVNVTIELCFAAGGKLSGVTPSETGDHFLESGMAEYQFGNDTIRFGPGNIAHRNIKNLEGERYSTHFGSLRTEGIHVYLTGTTPFNHKLTFN